MIEATGGWCEQVSEGEIALAKAQIGAEGIGCEPASAVTLAGTQKLVRSGHIQAGERVVLILTGHTLKDPEYTIDFHKDLLATGVAGADSYRKPPLVLEANETAVLRALEREMQAEMAPA